MLSQLLFVLSKGKQASQVKHHRLSEVFPHGSSCYQHCVKRGVTPAAIGAGGYAQPSYGVSSTQDTPLLQGVVCMSTQLMSLQRIFQDGDFL